MPEFTAFSIVLGIILAVVFGGANAYLGRRIGTTISASIPAAVLSMGVMRIIFKRDSILENNMAQTIEELKKEGLWFVCADMDGTPMTKLSMTGPIGLVIGAEGSGVSRLVREKCDMTASIPMKGEIDSLNASVAAGVLMYEIVRQRDISLSGQK